MEDILASIRRIITDDEAAEASADDTSDADGAVDETETDDILELTQMLQDDGTTVDLSEEAEAETPPEPEPEPEPMAEPESDTAVAEETEPETAAELETAPEAETEPEPDTKPAPDTKPEPATEPEPATATEVEALISEAASSASIEALSKLAMASESAPASTSELRVGGQGGTVEDLVVGILRPLMREWLDQNLPIIVERIVQKEIRRLVRQADTD